jgi:hypothetical protein
VFDGSGYLVSAKGRPHSDKIFMIISAETAKTDTAKGMRALAPIVLKVAHQKVVFLWVHGQAEMIEHEAGAP